MARRQSGGVGSIARGWREGLHGAATAETAVRAERRLSAAAWPAVLWPWLNEMRGIAVRHGRVPKLLPSVMFVLLPRE